MELSFKENDLRNIDNSLYVISGSFVKHLAKRDVIFQYLRGLVRECKMSNKKNYKKIFYFNESFNKASGKDYLVKLSIVGKYNKAEKMVQMLKSASYTPNTACILRKGEKTICTIIL